MYLYCMIALCYTIIMRKIAYKIANVFVLLGIFFNPILALAQADFNPHFIISDNELQNYQDWTRGDIQAFLSSKGSYLSSFQGEDTNGTIKSAADIIYNAAQTYQINPKYILVTLQKEQSLITDDTPTQRQLDWATGYAVCDGCNINDPKVQSHKGFGKQVDNTAGIMRWYYEHQDQSYVKKINTPIRIDNEDVTPQSWATAFLYTYTPHLHGNKNFHRIWASWFDEAYPNGTLLQSASSSEYWLIQNGQRRRFASKSALVSRTDPKIAIMVPEIDLSNYEIGTDISFTNFSILRVGAITYLLDYDTLRPFASDEVVRKLGFNPQEIDDVNEADLAGFIQGLPITVSSTAPLGVIYRITDLKGAFYLLKDNVFYPLVDAAVVEANFRSLHTEKHLAKDLRAFPMADIPLTFADGTLIQLKDSRLRYVVDHGKKRQIADDDTFVGMGYKQSNIVTVSLLTALNIPSGETLFLNRTLTSSKNKFLGDSLSQVPDLFTTKLPSYLVAEYPSGRIITGKDIDSRRPIASLTKLMTAYEALNQNFKLSGTMIYNAKQHSATPNSLKLVTGEKIKNADLFNSMLVGSVNATARMIAQNSGLSSENAFISAMNERLAEWGADSTSLSDVSGLDEQNKSTARDLLKIFTKVLSNVTIKDSLFQTKYSFKEVVNKNNSASHTFNNTNQLIALKDRNYRILASKTGYTEEAGAVMIMLVESRKTKKQYSIITLGNSDYKKRFEEPNKLATWIASGTVTITTSH
ncbi:MAG: D-alanyl-D-alanine carboxypeptidase [Candidatus Magasanikbacteria bacterium]|nr:D-alanyl-D-alanine carboxypeptidase [Candidatus Magasanikbacteria bacterium]